MTIKEYIASHIRDKHDHIRITEIPKSRAFCRKCFDDSEELIETTPEHGVWVCKRGHRVPAIPLPSGGVAQSPMR